MSLFQPIQLGALSLKHRVVMAPLTRTRAVEATLAPGPTAVEYYSQRASKGGLIISEGVPVSPETPYEFAPGIYTAEQQEGWKKVVDAVHAKGGLISMQLWHLGRASHASWGKHPLLASLGRPLPTVSSSPVPLPDKITGRDYETMKYSLPSTPRPLETEEIRTRLVDDFRKAAEAAKRVGFDAVEIHAAHGYLLNQFLCDSVNKRTDDYGGSIENRMRAMHQVVRAVIEVYGHDRVAIRISPTYKDSQTFLDCTDSNPELLYREVIKSLDQYKLAYLLLTEPRWGGVDPRTDTGFTQPMRNAWAKQLYSSKIIGCCSFTPETAKQAIENGVYDAIAFGRFFISNPDLPERLRTGVDLNIYDYKTFYLHDPVKGYIDYPFAGKEGDPKFATYPTIPQKQLGKISENATPAEKL